MVLSSTIAKDLQMDPQWLYWARKPLEALKEHFSAREHSSDRKVEEFEAALKFVEETYINASAANDSRRSHVVEFDKLWRIFAPNTLVTGEDRLGHDRIWKVLHSSTQKEFVDEEAVYVVTVQFSDFNGKAFGWAEEHITIPEFPGAMPLQELPIQPLYLVEEAERLRIYEQIIRRAQTQRDLSKSIEPAFTLRNYRGHGLVLDKDSLPRRAFVSRNDARILKTAVSWKKQVSLFISHTVMLNSTLAVQWHCHYRSGQDSGNHA